MLEKVRLRGPPSPEPLEPLDSREEVRLSCLLLEEEESPRGLRSFLVPLQEPERMLLPRRFEPSS